MSTPTRRLSLLVSTALILAATVSHAANPDWPNEPGEDPREAMPDDPGYFHPSESNGVDGDWNLWSFYPDEWLPINDGRIREEEVALGVGMHADRGWQHTTGAFDAVIAVLDSGVYWDNPDLVNKYFLHRGELDRDGARPVVDCFGEAPDDPMDADGNGYFNVQDYVVCPGELERIDGAGNANGRIDPQDLLLLYSDGVDDDGNGYIDDISGWDFFWDDNDPYDDTRFGHGNGEAVDSAAEGNNGISTIGVCPGCAAMMLRVGDSFVVDSNEFAAAVVYGVDNGAKVIQEALGALNMTPFAYDAIEYAYHNNTVVIASAADELSFHHNFPGTANHTVYVHAVTHDSPSRARATTFLNFNNCTNYGVQLLLSTPGGGCSSEATGKSSGHAGLLYSWAMENELDPPLSAEEVRGLMIMSVDDIDVDRDDTDPEKYQSQPGWDWHFGYGRNNVGRSLELMADEQIPPEVDIVEPLWFETHYPDRQGTSLEITGRVGARADGLPPRYDSYDWTLSVAVGHDPTPEAFEEVNSGTTSGIDGTLATLDLTPLIASLTLDDPPSHPHEHGFTLKLTACADAPGGETCGEFRKFAFLDRDEDLREGFPIHLGTSGDASSTFFDLDGDGDDELVLPTADGWLHAYVAEGGELDGFPVELGWRRGFDPEAEVNHYGQCAFREDRTGCPAWGPIDAEPRQTVVINAPAFGDLDGEGGSSQIVQTTFDGHVWAFEPDGSVVDGFPVRTDPELSINGPFGPNDRIEEGIASSAALEDLDGDGDLEIIVGAMDQHIYVWHHDGSLDPGFPVQCKDSEEAGGGHGARIIATPAVADIDNDGEIEMVVGTNEVYDEVGSRVYIVRASGHAHPDGPFENLDPERETPGPYRSVALQGDVLPVVGRGNPTPAALADWDLDGYVEFAIEGIGGTPVLRQWDGEELTEETIMSIATEDFGPLSNSVDDFSYTLISNGAFGILDESGELGFVKGAAGFRFAIAFIEGGKREEFDHQLAAWNTRTGLPYDGYPQVMDDWQFFMTPVIVDIDNDGLAEIINGSGGYRLRALNHRGEEVEGWPKHTGGWLASSPSVGDFDGDGLYDIATVSRNGWLFVFETEGSTDNPVHWNGMGHDPRNTNNYETEMPHGPTINRPDPGGDDVGLDAGPDVGGGDDAGQDATDASGDSGTTDTTVDVDSDNDADPTLDASDRGAETDENGGCGGCASAQSATRPSALTFLAVVGGLFLLRRRRR